MLILDRLHEPADLRGLSESELVQLAGEIRETIIRTVAATGGHLGSSLGVVEVTLALHRLLESPARPDRVGHRPPGLCAQAADRAPRAVPHAAPDRRHRRLPAAERVPARCDRRRPRRHRPLDRPGPGDGPRSPPLHGADRRRRGRRGAPVGAVAGGAQRHRPPPDAAPDRAQRQRDVHQPVRRCAVEVPLRDQAAPGLAAGQGRLGHRHGARARCRVPAWWR